LPAASAILLPKNAPIMRIINSDLNYTIPDVFLQKKLYFTTLKYA
jgi:hypothetical protein